MSTAFQPISYVCKHTILTIDTRVPHETANENEDKKKN